VTPNKQYVLVERFGALFSVRGRLLHQTRAGVEEAPAFARRIVLAARDEEIVFRRFAARPFLATFLFEAIFSFVEAIPC
jgi:hypothetical protein